MTFRHSLALAMAAFLTLSSLPARPAVLGVVVAADRVHLNTTAVTAGATIYDGDRFSTEESVLRLGGPMILRFKLECKAVAPKCSDDSLVTRRLASAPQACEVVGRGGQRPLDGHLGQASFPEPPHPALFFQDSVHRFDDGFAFAIGRAAGRVSQFPSHATMHRVAGPRAQRSAAIQVARQIRVRNVAVNLSLLQSL